MLRRRIIERIRDIHGSAEYVMKTLGVGFSESVQHRALNEELDSRGYIVQMEQRASVLFPRSDGTAIVDVGYGRPDLTIVDDDTDGDWSPTADRGVGFVEIKAKRRITADAMTQIRRQNRMLELAHVVPAWSVLVNFAKDGERVDMVGYMRVRDSDTMAEVMRNF